MSRLPLRASAALDTTLTRLEKQDREIKSAAQPTGTGSFVLYGIKSITTWDFSDFMIGSGTGTNFVEAEVAAPAGTLLLGFCEAVMQKNGASTPWTAKEWMTDLAAGTPTVTGELTGITKLQSEPNKLRWRLSMGGTTAIKMNAKFYMRLNRTDVTFTLFYQGSVSYVL